MKFLPKKSHRAENTLREYPLAPLSFLDDVKQLRKFFKKVQVLRMQEFMIHENCKKSGPFRGRLSAEKKLPTVIVGLFSFTTVLNGILFEIDESFLQIIDFKQIIVQNCKAYMYLG